MGQGKQVNVNVFEKFQIDITRTLMSKWKQTKKKKEKKRKRKEKKRKKKEDDLELSSPGFRPNKNRLDCSDRRHHFILTMFFSSTASLTTL